jgi:uncharacterized protein YcfJ
MNIQPRIIVSLLALGAVQCASAADFDDSARVISVTPRVEQFNQPQQECRTEYVQVQQQQGRGVGGSIIGGVAGALLGSQVGGGSGRTAAAAVGAITGAVVGDRMENNNANAAGVQQQAVQQCRTVDHWESRTTGYSVNYEYRGHSYTSVMPYDPGERLKVRVSVTPLQQQDQRQQQDPRQQQDLRYEQRQQWQRQ